MVFSFLSLSVLPLISGVQTFTVNTPSAKLVLKSPLDYEYTTSYLLTLKITDTGKIAQPSGNITIKVKQNNLNLAFLSCFF